MSFFQIIASAGKPRGGGTIDPPPTDGLEAETIEYVNAIGVAADSPTAVEFDKIIKGAAAFKEKLIAIYPCSGNTQAQQQKNALAPNDPTFDLQYQGSWLHNNWGQVALTPASYITINKSFADLGLSSNNVGIGFYHQSNGKGQFNSDPVNTVNIFGNYDNATQRTELGVTRKIVEAGLSNARYQYQHQQGEAAGYIFSTSNGTMRTFKRGVKLGEETNSGNLGSGNIVLHRVMSNEYHNSQQIASFFTITEGLTEAEAVTLSELVEDFYTNLGRNTLKVPYPVLYPWEIGDTSTYWPQIFKSSDTPLITTTKPYWWVASTDHDVTGGGIVWGECDNPEMDGMVINGTILSQYQSETPQITFRHGKVQLYYHTGGADPNNGGLQQTKMIESSGGVLHDTDWSAPITPLGLFNDDNHTGYARTKEKDNGDIVANHLTKSTAPVKTYLSISTDGGYSFTRLLQTLGTEGMPAGSTYIRNQMCLFEWNGSEYAFVIYRPDTGTQHIALVTVDDNGLPTGVVEVVSEPLDLRTMNLFIEGNLAYLNIKGGSNNLRYNVTNQVVYDLTEII